MAKHFQQFWSLFAVIICYGLGIVVLVYGGPEGTETVPQWAFSLVTLTFTAIIAVSLHLCLSARAKDSQEQEEGERRQD